MLSFAVLNQIERATALLKTISMARIFINYRTASQFISECVVHMHDIHISTDYTIEGAYRELIRQLDMGNVTDIEFQLDKANKGDILFKDCDNNQYALAIDKCYNRANNYQIIFSLYKSI